MEQPTTTLDAMLQSLAGQMPARMLAAHLRAAAARLVPASRGKLLGVSELAAKLGRGRTYVWAMTRAGYEFTHGQGRRRRTTLESALDWLAAHPEFHLESPRRSNRASSRRGESCGKRGEPSLRND